LSFLESCFTEKIGTMLDSIIGNVTYVVVVVILFSVTVFVHELGHFLVALRCGMIVDVLSIGFGPALWKKKIRGITYKIGCIPFGGYVALPQLDPAGMATIQGKEDEAGARGGGRGQSSAIRKDDEQAQDNLVRKLPFVSPFKKILVSLAGSAGNVVLAVILALVIYLSPGAVTGEGGGTLVGYVATNCPAFECGIRIGDEIVGVNGEPVSSWNEYVIECHLSGGRSNEVNLTIKSGDEMREVKVPTSGTQNGIQVVRGVGKAALCVVMDVIPGSSADSAGIKTNDIVKEFNGVTVAGPEHFVDLVTEQGGVSVPVTLERGGKLVRSMVTPRFDVARNRPLVGVKVSPGVVLVISWMQYKKPMAQIKGDTRGIVRILRAFVSRRKGEARKAAGALGGPVMILATLWLSIQSSFMNGVGFIRLVNVNLAIINLLPIPVLDGGHIVFSLWEGIVRRKLHPKFVNVVVNIFAALLIGGILLVTARDVPRVWRILLERRKAADSLVDTDPRR